MLKWNILKSKRSIRCSYFSFSALKMFKMLQINFRQGVTSFSVKLCSCCKSLSEKWSLLICILFYFSLRCNFLLCFQISFLPSNPQQWLFVHFIYQRPTLTRFLITLMFVSLIVSLVHLIFTQQALNAAPLHSDWHQSSLRSLVPGGKDSFHWLTVWIFNSVDSNLFMIVGNKAEENVTKSFWQTLWIKSAIFAAQRHNCSWCYMIRENRERAVVSLLCLSHI